MELTGAVLRRSTAAPVAGILRGSHGRLRVASGFADEGHLRYYARAAPVRCGGGGKVEEKRMRREAVAKELSALHSVGLVGAGEGTTSEAAHLLLAQINEMRDQEMEEEKKKKEREEEKAAAKAMKKQRKEEKKATAMNRCWKGEGGSSCSSESSDSECEEDGVINMSCRTTAAMPQMPLSESMTMAIPTAAPEILVSASPDISAKPALESCNGTAVVDKATMKAMKKKEKDEKKAAMKAKKKKEKEEKKAAAMKGCKDEDSSSCSSSESSDSEREEEVVNMRCRATISTPEIPYQSTEIPAVVPQIPLTDAETSARPAAQCSSSSIAGVDKAMNRIEVCMGGKCKKSGSLELLQEFEKKVGIEGAVVGCKCMGKCREGPNVRVLNQRAADEASVEVPKNPLCIGVGLDDVGSIVAGFFGAADLGLMAA